MEILDQLHAPAALFALSDTRLSHRASAETVTKQKFPTIAVVVHCWERNPVVCSLPVSMLTGLSLFGNLFISTGTVNMMFGHL